MAQVKQGLEPMSPTALADYGARVVAGMTGNAHFSTPNPPLASLTSLVSGIRDGQNEILDLVNQTSVARTNVQTLTDQLKTALGSAGNYVQGIADTQTVEAEAVEVIESANMKVRDEAKPIGQLPAPEKASVVDGHDDGTLEAHCSKVRGASSYLWQTCVGDNPITGAWGGDKVSTKTSMALTGFTLGSRVWMRVAGVGAAGTGDWSQPVSDIVT